MKKKTTTRVRVSAEREVSAAMGGDVGKGGRCVTGQEGGSGSDFSSEIFAQPSLSNRTTALKKLDFRLMLTSCW